MINHEGYVLWGSAGHAKVLADVIGLRGGRIIALFDNNTAAQTCLVDVPLFYGESGFREWVGKQSKPEGICAAVAIGGARGSVRLAILRHLRSAGLATPSLIHPSAVVARTANMGVGCHVLAGAVLAADTTMGDGCIINNSANVDHECRLGHGVHIAPGAVLCGCVTICDHAMIGAGAVVLPRLSIGRNTVIGAGAVVTRDVPDGMTVAGNPAKELKAAK